MLLLVLLVERGLAKMVIDIEPGEPHHADSSSPNCAELLLVDNPKLRLGNLREIADQNNPVAFKASVARAGGGPDYAVEFFADVGHVNRRDEYFQDVVRGLKDRSYMDSPAEREVGAISGVAPDGELIVVYFSSNERTRIERKVHQQAWSRFFAEMKLRLSPGETLPIIDRFHTHPSYANAPHTAPDIHGDISLDEWLRGSFLRDSRFRSFVVPLFYNGDIYCEFEPRRHHHRQLGPDFSIIENRMSAPPPTPESPL